MQFKISVTPSKVKQHGPQTCSEEMWFYSQVIYSLLSLQHRQWGLYKVWKNSPLGRIFSDYPHNIMVESQKEKQLSRHLQGKGVKRTNKNVLVIVVAMLTLAILATPVLAIGPQNAVKNPNVEVLSYGVSFESANGMTQEWVSAIDKHLMYKNAREYKINNALVITDISQVAENENKWLFFSAVIFGDWLCFVFRATPGSNIWIGLHMWALQNYPEGAYYREVLVGK